MTCPKHNPTYEENERYKIWYKNCARIDTDNLWSRIKIDSPPLPDDLKCNCPKYAAWTNISPDETYCGNKIHELGLILCGTPHFSRGSYEGRYTCELYLKLSMRGVGK